jgi:hypothetical protein
MVVTKKLIATTESNSDLGQVSAPHDPLLTIEKKLFGELTGGYSSAFFSLKLITAPSTCEWNWPRTV